MGSRQLLFILSVERVYARSYHVTAAIAPEQGYYVGQVDSLVFSDLNGGMISVLQSKIKECLGQFFQDWNDLFWLDEYQFIIAPMSKDRYKDLVKSITQGNFAETQVRGFSRGFMRNVFSIFK